MALLSEQGVSFACFCHHSCSKSSRDLLTRMKGKPPVKSGLDGLTLCQWLTTSVQYQKQRLVKQLNHNPTIEGHGAVFCSYTTSI